MEERINFRANFSNVTTPESSGGRQKDPEGNEYATIPLQLPTNLISNQRRPKRVEMQVTKMSVPLGRMPITQIPLEEVITRPSGGRTLTQVITKGIMTIWPFRFDGYGNMRGGGSTLRYSPVFYPPPGGDPDPNFAWYTLVMQCDINGQRGTISYDEQVKQLEQTLMWDFNSVDEVCNFLTKNVQLCLYNLLYRYNGTEFTNRVYYPQFVPVGENIMLKIENRGSKYTLIPFTNEVFGNGGAPRSGGTRVFARKVDASNTQVEAYGQDELVGYSIVVNKCIRDLLPALPWKMVDGMVDDSGEAEVFMTDESAPEPASSAEGENIVNQIEQAKKEDVNKPDSNQDSGDNGDDSDDDDDDDDNGDAPGPTSLVSLPAATTALQAEIPFPDVTKLPPPGQQPISLMDSGDTGAPPPPPGAAAITTDGFPTVIGNDDSGDELEVPDDSAPPEPPSSPPPPIPVDTESPPPSPPTPPPPEDAAPSPPPPTPPAPSPAQAVPVPPLDGISGEEPIDQDDAAILLSDGAPPAPPPAPAPVTTVDTRIQELEDELTKTKALLAEKQQDANTLLNEKQALASELGRIAELEKEKRDLLAKQAADMKAYEAEKANWEAREAAMKKNRLELEKQIDALLAKQTTDKDNYQTQLDGLKKQIADLQTVDAQIKADLVNAQNEYNRVAAENQTLSDKNNALATKIANMSDDPEEIQKLTEENDKIQAEAKQNADKLINLENQIRTLRDEQASTLRQLSEVQNQRDQFRAEGVTLTQKHAAELEALKQQNETALKNMRSEYEQERNALQAKEQTNENAISLLHTQVEEKQRTIDTINRQIALLGARIREQQAAQHGKTIDEYIKEIEDVVRIKNQQIADLRTRNQELEQRVSQLESELAEVKAINNKLVMEISSLQTKLRQVPQTETLIDLNATLEENKKVAGETIAALQQDLQHAKTESQQVRAQLQQRTQGFENARLQMEQEWNTRVQQLADENKRILSDKDAILDQKNQVERELIQLRAQFQTTSEQIEENERRINDLQKASIDQKTGFEQKIAEQSELINQRDRFLSSIRDIISLPPTEVNADVFKEQIKKIVETNREIGEKNTELQSELKTEQNKARVLQRSVELKESELKNLQQDFQRLLDAVGDQNTINALNPENQALSVLISTYKTTVDQVKNQLAQYKTAYQELQQTHTNLESNLNAQNALLASESAEKARALSANRELQAQIEQLRSDNDAKVKDLARISSIQRDLENKVKLYDQQIEQLNDEKSKLQNAKIQYEQEVALRVSKLNSDHAKEVDELRATLQLKDQVIAERDNDLKELGDKLDALNLQYQGLANRLTVEIGEKTTLQQELENVRDINQRLRDQIESLEEEIGEASARKRARDANYMAEPVPEIVNQLQNIPGAEGEMDVESAVSEAPPAVEVPLERQIMEVAKSGGVVLVDPDEPDISVGVYPLGHATVGKHRKRIFLIVKWDAKGSPKNVYYSKKDGRLMAGDYAPPNFPSPFMMQQFLLNHPDLRQNLLHESKILDIRSGFLSFVERQKAQADDKTPGEKLPAEPSPNPKVDLNEDTDTENVVILDHAQLLPVFLRLGEGVVRWKNIVADLFKKIRTWLSQMPIDFQYQFLTDPSYVPAERLGIIKENLRQNNIAENTKAAVDTIWTNLWSNIEKIHSSTVPEGFKRWMKNFNQVYKSGFTVNLSPRIIYHTLASVLHDTLFKHSTLRGFGYAHTSGMVSIPTAHTVKNGLFDYYGYGFDPFTKTLNNPPGYYTSDYSGYSTF